MSSYRSWPLERFAKCISVPNMAQSYRDPNNWKEISRSQSSDLWVSCTGFSQMLISSISGGQSQIHESFSLFEAKKWLRAAVKGDSVLFLYKHKDDTRRFRIKFCTTSSKSSLEVCRDFVKAMAGLFSIKDVAVAEQDDSQVPMEDSQTLPSSQASSGSTSDCAGAAVSLADLTRKSSRSNDAQKAYENTNVPTSRLGLFIRLCLTDANFPAFVEEVEKELSQLVSKN